MENIRQRLVTDGFEVVLNGKKRESPPRGKVLDGEQEARVMALRLGEPPEGFTNWSLRLLADKVVELGIVESVSHETLRKTLKKRYDKTKDPVLGNPTESQQRICCMHGRGFGHLRHAL